MTDDVDQEVERAPIHRLGAVLRDERNARSYSIAYVASQTLLSEETVSALEEEAFDQLPSPVFVRGYIRTYAKLLEIDAEPLINSYGQEDTSQDAPLTSVRSSKASLSSSLNNQMPVWSTLAVAVVVLGLVASWWLHQETEQPIDITTAAEVVGNVTPENTTELLAGEVSYAVGLGAVSDDNESSLQPSKVTVGQAEEIDVISELAPEISQGEDEQELAFDIQTPIVSGNVQDGVKITITFVEESWAEIFDVRKRRLLHGLIKPGAVRVIYGEAPFNVFFGNAPGVELQINDQPFDHIPFARKNNTARFQIEDINT